MANRRLKVFVILLALALTQLSPIRGIPDQGIALWQNYYGGFGDDHGYAAQLTSDGGYLIVGSTNSFKADQTDVYLVRTDSIGKLQWQKTFGGLSNQVGESLILTEGDGSVVVGTTSSLDGGETDVYLIKVDSVGNLLWQNTYGGAGYDYGKSIQATSDGGFIIAGSTNSTGSGGMDILLIRVDEYGDVKWQKTYGGPDDDYGVSVLKSPDGGFIVAGNTHSYGSGGSDIILLKTDGLGNNIWQKTYGGVNDDEAYSLHTTVEGGYIIAGSTESFGTGDRLTSGIVITINAEGDQVQQRILGAGKESERTYSAIQTRDGGFLLLDWVDKEADAQPEIYVYSTDSTLNTQWTLAYGDGRYDVGNYLELTPDGGYSIIGSIRSLSHGGTDVYLIHEYDRLAPHADAGTDQTLVNTYKVEFNGIGSTGPMGGNIVKYMWDFGDGSQGLGINPSHTYAKVGLYNVTLTVTDGSGRSSSDSMSVAIKLGPKASDYINATLTIDSVIGSLSTQAEITMWNHKDPIMTGEGWWLDKFVNGEWNRTKLGPSVVIAIGYSIQTNGSRTFTIQCRFDMLPDGLYRIGKDYFLENGYYVARANAYAEFWIVNSRQGSTDGWPSIVQGSSVLRLSVYLIILFGCGLVVVIWLKHRKTNLL